MRTKTINEIAADVGINDKTARAKIRSHPEAFPTSLEAGRYIFDMKSARTVAKQLQAA